jgi:equilibrative nucleoside transporter 1/2/3
MFLAAAPYFNIRFQADPWISANSQSAILTTFTAVSLVTLLILAGRQASANYPARVSAALIINAGVFSLLTLSTSSFLDASPPVYLAFLLLMVAMTAFAAGLMQNGAFSFAASFGQPEYTQAIMAGQGVAGILPPLAQILSFLAFDDSSSSAPGQPGGEAHPAPPSSPSPPPPDNGNKGSSAAFIYFLTAVLISTATLVAFIPLVRSQARRSRPLSQLTTPSGEEEDGETAPGHAAPPPARRYVPLGTLLRKLRWLAAAVVTCFALTMFFPVFTAKILSVHDPTAGAGAGAGRLFAPGAFIPLGFFFWNLGDLAGRVSTLLPCCSLRRRPRLLFALALLRGAILPLYLLCNLHGRGAVVESDVFYLGVVQVLFGLTNGWVGSSAMMAAGEWVAEGEREAAGGFMGLCLVAGLAVGSVLSFSAAGV